MIQQKRVVETTKTHLGRGGMSVLYRKEKKKKAVFFFSPYFWNKSETERKQTRKGKRKKGGGIIMVSLQNKLYFSEQKGNVSVGCLGSLLKKEFFFSPSRKPGCISVATLEAGVRSTIRNTSTSPQTYLFLKNSRIDRKKKVSRSMPFFKYNTRKKWGKRGEKKAIKEDKGAKVMNLTLIMSLLYVFGCFFFFTIYFVLQHPKKITKNREKMNVLQGETLCKTN